MTERLTILVGTMTGTADLVAQDVRDALEADGAAVEIAQMDGLGADALAAPGLYLICTSTYGQGDVPDNARGFFEALEAARPSLAHIRYGVIALGDRTYAGTFCDGGRRFDALLAGLGARRMGEPLLHDASSGDMAEEVAVAWARPWFAAAADAGQLAA